MRCWPTALHKCVRYCCLKARGRHQDPSRCTLTSSTHRPPRRSSTRAPASPSSPASPLSPRPTAAGASPRWVGEGRSAALPPAGASPARCSRARTSTCAGARPLARSPCSAPDRPPSERAQESRRCDERHLLAVPSVGDAGQGLLRLKTRNSCTALQLRLTSGLHPQGPRQELPDGGG